MTELHLTERNVTNIIQKKIYTFPKLSYFQHADWLIENSKRQNVKLFSLHEPIRRDSKFQILGSIIIFTYC